MKSMKVFTVTMILSLIIIKNLLKSCIIEYKQVWEITRKKLKLNYSKPSPRSPNRPSNRREILKKN